MPRFPHPSALRAIPLALALCASGCASHRAVVSNSERTLRAGLQRCYGSMQNPPSTLEELEAQEAAYRSLVDRAFDENIALYGSETLYTPRKGVPAMTYEDWIRVCTNFWVEKYVALRPPSTPKPDSLPGVR